MLLVNTSTTRIIRAIGRQAVRKCQRCDGDMFEVQNHGLRNYELFIQLHILTIDHIFENSSGFCGRKAVEFSIYSNNEKAERNKKLLVLTQESDDEKDQGYFYMRNLNIK